MTDAPTDSLDGESLPSAADKLIYADIEPPESGRIVPIGSGVHWLRMPLLGELGHINLWLIEHAGGFVAVDTGMATSEGKEVWNSLREPLLKDLPLQLIVVTHLHPDHVGLAAWLQEQFDVPVWMSSKSEDQVRDVLTPKSKDEISTRIAFLQSHGVANTPTLTGSLIGEKFRDIVSGVPVVDRHPQDGDEVVWGGVRWQFLEVGGHAAGHLCLHAPELKILISGDQVLPTISPNISLHETRLDANPLSSYLGSLDRLAQLDSQTLVLPSHGRPFYGLRPRAMDLRNHHFLQLDRLRAACAQPLTAERAITVMFARTLRGFHWFLAIGEAIAHLEYLAAVGRVKRCVGDDGRVHFLAE